MQSDCRVMSPSGVQSLSSGYCQIFEMIASLLSLTIVDCVNTGSELSFRAYTLLVLAEREVVDQ